jgi:hypothetical protein
MPANCRSANTLTLGNLIGLDAADFVLLDASPLEDISNTRRIISCRFLRCLSLAFVHEDLPGRAPASSAVVTTAACFAMTMSSSIACTSTSGSAQQSRTTINR